MQYRRSKAAGGTYFFTVNLADRSSSLLVEHVAELRQAVRTVKQRHPFDILAWVVLPEHMHAVWTLPPSEDDFSTRWMLIKSGFSRGIERRDPINASCMRKGERGIWQRRFWEHQIRDENDLARHIDYVHINPVKHGHAGMASDWPYSSIHRYIRNGLLASDWAADANLPDEAGAARNGVSRKVGFSRRRLAVSAANPNDPQRSMLGFAALTTNLRLRLAQHHRELAGESVRVAGPAC